MKNLNINQVFGKYGNGARDTLYDECAATGAGHSFGPHGMSGEIQCRYCGEADTRKPKLKAHQHESIATLSKSLKNVTGKFGSVQHNGGDVSAEELNAMIRELFDGQAKPPHLKPLAVAIACCYPNVPKGIW